MKAYLLLLLFLTSTMVSCKMDHVIDDGSEQVYPDNHKINLAPGFEKYLIKMGIDTDTVPNGSILYRHIKDIDSLFIHEWFDVGDKNLNGIEGFTNLQTFTTVSLGVKTIDFSGNKKLKRFATWGWGHCVGCGTLTSLVFGEQSKLETLSLSGTDKLISVDFMNLKNLKSLHIYTADNLRYQDISACTEIETIEFHGRTGIILGYHPKLKQLACGAFQHHVDFTKLPALETLRYTVDGRHTPDFSNNKELKNLLLVNLRSAKLDVSANIKLENLEVTGDWTQISIDLSKNVNLKKCLLVGSQLATICVSSLSTIDFSNWVKNQAAQYKVCN